MPQIDILRGHAKREAGRLFVRGVDAPDLAGCADGHGEQDEAAERSADDARYEPPLRGLPGTLTNGGEIRP